MTGEWWKEVRTPGQIRGCSLFEEYAGTRSANLVTGRGPIPLLHVRFP